MIVCIALFASGLVALSRVHVLWLAAPILLFLGVNWVIIPTNFNTATQKSVPPWVKGRAISFYLTVLFGSFAIGGAIWGRVTTRYATELHPGISTSLFVGGLSMALLLVLAIWFPLTINEGLDLSPANVSGPDLFGGVDPKSGPASGPIDVHIDYHIDPARGGDFLKLMRDVGRQRRRNGASHWRLEPLPVGGQSAIRYREICRFHSPAEFNRQPARMTRADVQLLGEIRPMLHGGAEQPLQTAIVAAAPRSSGMLSGREPQPLYVWVLSRLAASFERTIDEAEAAADRFAAMRRRERRGSVHMRISIEIPVADDRSTR